MGQVRDLVVNSKLLTLVLDDENADVARATGEGLLELGPEVALVDDLETLLDLASFGHGDELAVVTDVDEAVLLEDRSEEGVGDDGRRGVRDNARLLMELLGEEVNTKVPVLTGLGRGGDADNLAWAVLEDDEITDADVVARDGEGVLGGRVGRRDVRRRRLLGSLGVVAVIGLAAGGGGGLVFVGVVLGHCFGRLSRLRRLG